MTTPVPNPDAPPPPAGTPASAADVSAPQASRPRPVVLPTTYLWLLVFALVLLADAAGVRRPAATPPTTTRAAKTRSADAAAPVPTAEPITAQTFDSYVQAELQARSAFGAGAASSLVGAGTTPASTKPVQKRAFNEAIAGYRRVLQSGTPAPGPARHLLIVEHAAGRPLDTGIVNDVLPRALKAANKSPFQIKQEQQLWRALYGGNKNSRIARADLAAYDTRLQQLRLRFLEDRARADLHERAGDAAGARRLSDRFSQKTLGFQFRLGGIFVLGLLGFLLGLVFLGLFLWTAADKRWPRIARVPTQAQRLPFGELLDAFVFYLAFYRGFGLLVGVVLPVLVPDRSRFGPTGVIAVGAAVQFFGGLVALWYLAAKARGRGASLADVGLSVRPGLASNVFYGVAGYLAMLPVVFALAWVSQRIFQHFPNATPNPILPLLTSSSDFAPRLLIFTMVAVGAPFFEELFFRGALFTGLRTRLGWSLSALACAVVFALVHPPSSWLPIVGLGFGLSALREMRQSLVPCFVAHFLQNAAVFVFMSLLFSS